MKKTLLIWVWEIWGAVKTILEENGYQVSYIRKEERDVDGDVFQFVHVALPFSQDFEKILKGHLEWIDFECCIIHSTTPVWFIKSLGDNRFVHSPVRWVHPNLVPWIKTFVKFVWWESEYADIAIRHQESLWIKCKKFASSDETELAKILSTTYYWRNILFAKQCKALCDELWLDYDNVYTVANNTYNKWYKELGMANVCRPVLYPPEGRIWWHCITPNRDLLPDCELKHMSKKLNNL